MWKKIFSCMLCMILVAVPFVQRTHAVVTTASLAAVLILTVMVAMGITLVVAEGSKEDFILNKGNSFMTAKGYPGSFQDWILSGTRTEIGLKTGFLLLSKTVVDNIKDFVGWLCPNASSNTVVDLSSQGGVVPLNDAIIMGDISQLGSGRMFFSATKVFLPAYSVQSVFSDGNNTVTFYSSTSCSYLGYYDTSGNFVNSGLTASVNHPICLIRNNTVFVRPSDGLLFPVGIYTAEIDDINSSSSTWWRLGVTNPYNARVFLDDSFISSVPSTDNSAIIGNYDDLDDLTDTTTVGSGGTTTVSNTFYITTDGQALDPSTQDLADILDALRQALENQNQKTEVTGWTTATAAEGEVSPPYDDFDLGKLDFNGLRALITTRFPFCIPWDFVRIIELFVADPEAPHWEFDILPISAMEDVDTTLSLDLGDYPIVGIVSRWFCIIDLCLGLVFATKKLIWTA